MRTAVVGHVEWVEFVRVEQVPTPGAIIQASESWTEAAGGGALAAVRLAALSGRCTLYTALGRDALGDASFTELTARGVRVEAARVPEPQRRGFTFVDAQGERTITIIGEKHVPSGQDGLPWSELGETDAVYLVSGDAHAVRAARQARVLVATARALPVLQEAGVELDALVRSARDPSERYEPGDLDPRPKLVVATDGGKGGTWRTAGGEEGSYEPAPLGGPVADAYGAGDSFAAGLTYALGRGEDGVKEVGLAAPGGGGGLGWRGAS